LLRKWLGFVAASACLGAGCFTDPVNMSPTVRIDPPAPFFRGQSGVTYKATVIDPDGDTPLLQWALVPGRCQAADPPTRGWIPATEFDVPSQDTMSAFCVFAKVTDRYGASSLDEIEGDPQDHPPKAVLDLLMPADAPSFKVGQMFVLSAEKSTDEDPGDANTLLFAWTLKSAPPQTSQQLLACPDSPSNPARKCLTADAAGDYQVELTVTDSANQPSVVDKTLHVDPGQLGSPAIDLVSPSGNGPYPLGSLFQVSGQNSDGVDLGYNWTFDPPPGADMSSGPCNDPKSQCFTADIPGTYRVGLSVKNEAGDSPVVWATFVVAPDQPPCIEHTTPDFAPSTTILTSDTNFVVDLVSDDLDPFPSTEDMQWWESDNDGAFRLVENGFPSFTLHPASYLPGDQVRLRLEVRDRDTNRADKAFLACGNADFCTEPSLIHPDACFQRVTWTVMIR
jgi:hypothetical protein